MTKTDKAYEDKNIIERHTIDNKFSLTGALNEQDARIANLVEEVKELKKAMGFLAVWYEENYGSKLILPTVSQTNEILKTR